MENEFSGFGEATPQQHKDPKDRSTLIMVIVVGVMIVALVLGVIFGMSYINKDEKPPENTSKTEKPANNADTQKEFKENLELFHDTAKDFFANNLPEKVNEGLTLKLSQMYEEGLIGEMKFGGKSCDDENSKTAILKISEDEYTILTTLICGSNKDETKETIMVITDDEGGQSVESVTVPDSITYYETIELGNNIRENISKTITSEVKMTTITGILANKTVNTQQGGLGGMNIPYLEIYYPSKTVKVLFMSPSTDDFSIDGTMYRINYSGNAYEDIKRVFTGSNVITETDLDLRFYAGLRSATLTTYYLDFTGIQKENKQTSYDDLVLKKVAAALENAVEYEATGFGGVGISSLKLTYDDRELIVGFLADDIISIDGKTYKINYQGADYEEDIKAIFNAN